LLAFVRRSFVEFKIVACLYTESDVANRAARDKKKIEEISDFLFEKAV
jgi:hypothetical protein